MASLRRVVITGIGVVTPLGLEVSSFWEGLRLGRSGVRRVQSFDTSGLPVHIGAEIEGFDARNYLEKKERKRLGIMVRTFQFIVAAAQLALEDGLVDKQALDPTRFGVVAASATIPGDLRDLGHGAVATAAALKAANVEPSPKALMRLWGEHGIPCVPPLWLLTHIPNMMACHVSILHNAQGPNNTITQSDVSGLLALQEACRYISRDQADLVLVGGADCNVTIANYLRHCMFDKLSLRNDAPEKASRPFDRDRDGGVLGEGGGVLVVEDLEHAQRRGARIYAEITGMASGFDAGCTGKGLAKTIRAALDRAAVGPADVDHVNAQGNSTVFGDAWEARALAAVFGPAPKARPVFAGKGALGNLGAAANTVELAASLFGQQHGLIPHTINHEHTAPDCPVRVLRENKPLETPHFLKVGFTEMGQCAAVVCRKWVS